MTITRPGATLPITLPTTRQIPKVDLIDYPTLFYTIAPGTGASCLIASLQFYLDKQGKDEKCLYIDCDPSQSLKAHSLYCVSPTNWSEFVECLKQGALSDNFQWIAIDHLHWAYEWNWNLRCEELSISHPGDKNDMGKTWNYFTRTFIHPISKVIASKKGVLATSQSENSQIMWKGTTYNLWVPSFVGGKARSAHGQIMSLFPLIGFLHPEGVAAPPTKTTDVRVVDIRAAGGPQETDNKAWTERRILEFNTGKHWFAKDRARRFSESITLPEDYREDWALIQDIWERGGER